MQKISNIRTAGLVLVLYAVMQTGCATHKAVSLWQGNDKMIADGNDGDWRITPQYYDKAKQVSISATNDGTGIFLCFSTADPKLKQKIVMTGLTVWLDPEGGKNKVLGVCAPSGQGPPGPPFSGRGGSRTLPPEKKGMPRSEIPDALSITYPHTTGPLTMTRAHAKNAGIEAGGAMSLRGKAIYEFKIRFDADESLLALTPGKMLGVGFETGKMDPPNHTHINDVGNDPQMPGSNMGPPDRGTGPGMGAGPANGKPPAMRKGKSYEVWIKVRLAGK